MRFILPTDIVARLALHPLARGLYPTSFGFYERAEAHFIRRDAHDDWLFLYCVDGHAMAEYGGSEHPVQAGDLLVLPCGVPHAYWAVDPNPWTIYWVHFSGQQAAKYLENIPASASGDVLKLGVRPTLVSGFRTLLDTRQPPYRLRAFVHAANHLKGLLTYLSLVKLEPRSAGGSTFDLERVHALMEQQVDGSLNLDTLAASMHLSKYHFAKTYRRVTGVSPIAHFIHLKIERACRLLDSTPSSVKEIAGLLGYHDPYYFSRLFKKVMGYSPEQYRRLNRG